jgi:8-amino-7-oxononanoate synthase
VAALDFLDDELARLRRDGLWRDPDATPPDPTLLDLTSNDYLALAREPVSRETLLACSGIRAGAGASRLLDGTDRAHLALEAALAAWVRLPSALLFSTGYAANVGAMSALAGPGDLVVSDALNHASLIDGCRLSRATVRVTPHRDVDAVVRALDEPARRRFVVVEGLYSMDGDSPDLRALREVTQRAGAILVVDEAHSLGVFGPRGAGLCAEQGVVPDVFIGTLGKAVGAAGAFVAGRPELRAWLWNRARSFVFSTAPSPLLAAVTLDRVLTTQAADARRAHLLGLAGTLTARLRGAGLNVPADTRGPIVPVLLGDPERALAASASLRRAGLHVRAIRPPTVPEGTSRLRVSLHAGITAAQLDAAAAALGSLAP